MGDKTDKKRLIYIGITIMLSFIFIVGIVNLWNKLSSENYKKIDKSETSIINAVNKELEDDKDMYQVTVDKARHVYQD